MRKVFGMVAVVVALMSMMMFGEPAVQTWIGDGAYAKRSNSCYRRAAGTTTGHPNIVAGTAEGVLEVAVDQSTALLF